MPDLFGLDLAGIVNDALTGAGGLRPATLTKVTPGTRTPGSLTGGTNPTSASYPTQGIAQTTTQGDPGTLTARTTTIVTLLGAKLIAAGVEPTVGDRVTIGNVGDADRATYELIGPVSSDSSGASYQFTAALR